MILYRDLASRVALVMAPLLPRIRRGVENMGLGKRGGGENAIDTLSTSFKANMALGITHWIFL